MMQFDFVSVGKILFGRGKVAQLNRVLHQTRHHVVRIRVNLQLSYRPDLPSRFPRHHFLHGFDQFRRGKQGVTPLRHGSSARVVRKSANLHLIFINADDPFDHADWNSRFVERSALLNMQFEITAKRGGRDVRLHQSRRIAANFA